jgi:hypothetical protein
MDASAVGDWDEVRPLVLESYRLIAPRRTVAKMDGSAAPAPRRPRARPAARKAAKKAAKKVAKKAAKTSRAPRP